MGMIYLGDSCYIDSDDLSDCEYAEFRKHQNNLRMYYDKRNNESTILKGKMLGIDIPKMIEEAEKFIAYNFLYLSNWEYEDEKLSANSDLTKAIICIAHDVEE